MFKRIFDLLFGFTALLLALPVMALSVLMVYLEDGSPVIFRQKRIGKDGRLFEMFKIRTMVKGAEQIQSPVENHNLDGRVIHKMKNDPRTTRVGRLLRRFSIDELPQLFNVLTGTMSLVGPRPELPHLLKEYEPWQQQRFSVLPGMTGWWQITNRNIQPMHLHIEDDLYYIQNSSVWLDLWILVRTIWVVLIGKGAY
jgi:lipopolysaccharide/colanic/teichoic acid biosynthesis glycosyltransferase